MRSALCPREGFRAIKPKVPIARIAGSVLRTHFPADSTCNYGSHTILCFSTLFYTNLHTVSFSNDIISLRPEFFFFLHFSTLPAAKYLDYVTPFIYQRYQRSSCK